MFWGRILFFGAGFGTGFGWGKIFRWRNCFSKNLFTLANEVDMQLELMIFIDK